MKKMLLKLPMRGLRVDADVHPEAYCRRSENSTLLGEPNNVLEFDKSRGWGVLCVMPVKAGIQPL